MLNKKSNDKVNYKDVNEILSISKNILKILFVLMIVAGVFIALLVLKELKIINMLLSILSVLSPLFIGLVIAWLFNPFVNLLEKKGIRRILGVTISYLILILVLTLIISSLIPVLSDQIKELTNTVPAITDNIKNIINSIFDKVNNLDIIDANQAKAKIYSSITGYGHRLYNTFPTTVVNGTLSFLSGIGNCLVGLIIGFFMLLGFNNISDSILIFLPQKLHKSSRELFSKINKALRGYVNGALFDATIIFVACSLVFALIGLKSPILFALFCAIMNVIPYAGPYIGALPALLVAFSQSFGIGIGVAISIIVIQMLEGNILSPIVMSKTTKLHPVMIMVGLLIFGHFFGILGMLLSTPIIGVLKVIIEFIDNKYHIFSEVEKNEES